MKKLACRYSIIRFVPFPETEEFANIGIVLACPETGYFDVKLQKRRYRRITDFFSDLDSAVYREAVSKLEEELVRIKGLASGVTGENQRRLFDTLCHPREAIIRFSESRVRLAVDAPDAIDKLFSYYVERDFVTPEYHERILEHQIKTLVLGLKLVKPFKPMPIGDELVTASFPLVQASGETPIKVIKPFFLDQEVPSKIINHGGPWVDKVKRLRKRNLLPKDVLFAVKAPREDDSKRYGAFMEICNDLKAHEISVLADTQHEEIIEFAIGDNVVF